MSIPRRGGCSPFPEPREAGIGLPASQASRLSAILLAAALGLSSLPVAEAAGALDWLASKRPSSKAESREPAIPAAQPVSQKGGAMPEFFASEAQPDVTGKSLNLVKFVEAHWMHSGKNLDTVTRALTAKLAAKKCSDIAVKLMTIDLQSYKEAVKAGAVGINGLGEGNRVLDQLLVELNRIITAPREETMSSLEKTLAKIIQANQNQMQLTRTYLAAAEQLIAIGQESYQTLELIPTLSIAPLDIYVQASKAIMKQVRSSSEALKGLLLNVQNGCEQVTAGVELMTATIKTTLRFSDHFAFAQYPLINLPVPAREKLFSQLSALRNTTRGIDNTLSIGDSHVKNATQQFAHLCEAATVKIRDSLAYLNPMDAGNGNLNQIAGYAHNQVSGLYQRLKEGVAEMKMAMAKAGRAEKGIAPQIALESGSQAQERRAAGAAGEKLPLFLLGNDGKHRALPSAEPSPRLALTPAPLEAPSPMGETTVLYREDTGSAGGAEPGAGSPVPRPDGFGMDEMGILRQELGGDIPYMRSAQADSSLNGTTDPSASAMMLPDDSLARADLPDSGSGDGRDLELMRMESTPSMSDASDLIPMLRLDDPGTRSAEE
ncbi:MAG TPA: hypothetical protein PLP29_15105 [Candidatus Ozemobacteraceae bacterium]|nr:hypothetical protein [Candidatus Ozemobacteraceae bacterium]